MADTSNGSGINTELSLLQKIVSAIMYPFFWLILKLLYRVKVVGKQHIPATGPAIVVCNHVSWLDGLFLYFNIGRPIRFLVWAPYVKSPFLRWLLQLGRVIPISAEGGPRQIIQAFRTAAAALDKGDLVGIFAEGGLTRNGFMLPFKRGYEQIVKKAKGEVKIIPACLDRLWGSIFSWNRGKLFWKWPKQIPYRVTVSFGEPMPATAEPWQVRQQVQELMADSFNLRRKEHLPLHRQFFKNAMRHPFRLCITDPDDAKKNLTYLKALTGAVLLSRELKPVVGDAEMVGILLPTVTSAAIVNVAMSLLGKTAVNLNYTASELSVMSAVEQCKIKTVITSRMFVKKLEGKFKVDFGPNVKIFELENCARSITPRKRTLTFLQLLLTPRWITEYWVLKLGNHSSNDLATIIFSSGSTGDPKGVMLSHHNLVSNIESVSQAINIVPEDVLLAPLPLFHSFGYCVGLWMPLLTGCSAIYYPDPRQAKEIADLARKFKATLYIATPTFLRFFLRKAGKDDFASVRMLITGAEKLPPSLRDEFHKSFGVMPQEGYGTTELSPVVSVNVPDIEKDGVRQVGSKAGTIGQPLPGIAVKVVDPDTGTVLPPNQPGMLLVYGPNVMEGYFGKPELSKEVIRDGKWYITGDIAKLDDDGFIIITDRLSRFSKVAGEMVPHQKVEDELHKVFDTAERMFAVVGVPDEKRGEKLIVLHLCEDEIKLKQAIEDLEKVGMPNLWLPDPRSYYKISEMPVLGTGKLDLRGIKKVAMELVGKK